MFLFHFHHMTYCDIYFFSLQSLLDMYLAMVGALPRGVPNGILLEYNAYSRFLKLEPLDNLSD